MESRNQFRGIDSARINSLGGPVRQIGLSYRLAWLGSIPGLLKMFINTGSGLNCTNDVFEEGSDTGIISVG